MIDRGLASLPPDFRRLAERVDRACNAAGFDLLIYSGRRTLEEQAVLYRQSRPFRDIKRKADQLRIAGFPILADALLAVGPQHGDHATDAAPGESWHNYGRAFDAVPIIGGQLDWNPTDKFDARKVDAHWLRYAAEVRAAGLQWGGDWPRFRDYAHAQLGNGSNPLRSLRPDQLREALAA